MRFVKFKNTSSSVIAGKEYNIEIETEKEVCFIDEDGEISTRYIDSTLFEIIDKPVMVYAYDDDELGKIKVELVHDLGETFKHRYICKDASGETTGWQNIEYIKYKPKKVKELNEIDSLKEDVNLLKGQVSEILRLLNEKI